MQKKNNERGVGDINSTSRGSAARYNSGKPRIDLLPLYMIVDSLDGNKFDSVQTDAFNTLKEISEFQRSGEEVHIDNALKILSRYWIDCANAFEYGAKKYASWNWVKGMNWSVPIGSIGRHCFALFDGMQNDEESGLPHIGHIMCNVVMLKTYVSSFPEGNDLPPKKFSVE